MSRRQRHPVTSGRSYLPASAILPPVTPKYPRYPPAKEAYVTPARYFPAWFISKVRCRGPDDINSRWFSATTRNLQPTRLQLSLEGLVDESDRGKWRHDLANVVNIVATADCLLMCVVLLQRRGAQPQLYECIGYRLSSVVETEIIAELYRQLRGKHRSLPAEVSFPSYVEYPSYAPGQRGSSHSCNADVDGSRLPAVDSRFDDGDLDFRYPDGRSDTDSVYSAGLEFPTEKTPTAAVWEPQRASYLFETAFEHKHKELVQKLDASNEVLNMLLDRKVLTHSHVREIKAFASNETRVEKMLEWLMKRPDDMFEPFLEVLRASSQPHIADLLTGNRTSTTSMNDGRPFAAPPCHGHRTTTAPIPQHSGQYRHLQYIQEASVYDQRPTYRGDDRYSNADPSLRSTPSLQSIHSAHDYQYERLPSYVEPPSPMYQSRQGYLSGREDVVSYSAGYGYPPECHPDVHQQLGHHPHLQPDADRQRLIAPDATSSVTASAAAVSPMVNVPAATAARGGDGGNMTPSVTDRPSTPSCGRQTSSKSRARASFCYRLKALFCPSCLGI